MSPNPITQNTLFYGDILKILYEYIPSKSEDRIKTLYNKLIQSSWGKEQSVIQLGQTLSMNK